MSSSLVVEARLANPAINAWGGGPIGPTAEGSLRLEVAPDRVHEAHDAIDALAKRAHDQLDQALADITTLSGGEYHGPAEPLAVLEPGAPDAEG